MNARVAVDKPVILFRASDLEQEQELAVAESYFDVYRLRSEVPPGSIAIGRFSVLPYYRELEADLRNRGSRLINSPSEHEWIANFDYYQELKDYTPRSWLEHEYRRSDYDGPMVVKGRTNSRKAQWSTKCFAKDYAALLDVASQLANDPLIGPQGLIYRQYVPLKTFEVCPIGGTPITNEWRFFYYRETMLSASYYWTNASEETFHKAQLTEEAYALADTVARIAANHVQFFALDLAELQDGGWTLIEVNDGQQAGVPSSKWAELYGNLRRAIS